MAEQWYSSDDIVIASGENFADALFGGPFASALRAPILLTAKDQLPKGTFETLERLAVKVVYVLGGKNTVSEAITDQLKEKGYAVVRLEGANRRETASEIAKSTYNLYGTQIVGDRMLLASGVSFADALSAAPFAHYARASQYAGAFLPYGGFETTGTVIGGTNTIPKLENEDHRIAGDNRYETSAKLADIIAGELKQDVQVAYIADGTNYPDALTAAPDVTDKTGVILLTQPDVLNAHAKRFIEEHEIKKIYVIGGENSVSKQVENELNELIK